MSTSDKKTLITTLTGEPYQPARVYYQVFNQRTVIGAFEKLRCMQFEPRLNCWKWLYEREAQKIKFTNSYNKIPKEQRPIVIGDFYFRDGKMLLDVRSFDRVTKAISFFDTRINRRAAKATKIRVVNKFFSREDIEDDRIQPPFDSFFDRDDLEIPDPKELERQMTSIAEEHEDTESRMAKLYAHVEENAKKPLPEVEELPLFIYDEGISRLQVALAMRTLEAVQHWQGNTSFSQLDIMNQVTEIMRDKFVQDLPS